MEGDSRRSEVTQMQVRSDDKYEGGTWGCSQDCGGVSRWRGVNRRSLVGLIFLDFLPIGADAPRMLRGVDEDVATGQWLVSAVRQRKEE